MSGWPRRPPTSTGSSRRAGPVTRRRPQWSARPPSRRHRPAAPGGLTATAVSSSRIDVAWQDVAGESGYAVQRSATGTGGWTQVGTTGQDVTAFSDTGLAASTTYYYRVVAASGSGSSPSSAVVRATTLAPPPPAAPTGIRATAVSSSRIDVAWQDGAGESGYQVQRSAGRDERLGAGGVDRSGRDGVLRHRPGRVHDLLLPGGRDQRERRLAALCGGCRDDLGGRRHHSAHSAERAQGAPPRSGRSTWPGPAPRTRRRPRRIPGLSQQQRRPAPSRCCRPDPEHVSRRRRAHRGPLLVPRDGVRPRQQRERTVRSRPAAASDPRARGRRSPRPGAQTAGTTG